MHQMKVIALVFSVYVNTCVAATCDKDSCDLQSIAKAVDAGEDPAANLLQKGASKTVETEELNAEQEKVAQAVDAVDDPAANLNQKGASKTVEAEELNAEQKKATQATNASSSSATVIGQSTGVIDGSAASCRETKCAYGMLLTDELLRYGKTVNSKTQIALYNGGGIRASIPKGDVTDEHLKAVHPYGNHIILAEVPGSAIKTMVEVALKEHGAPLTGEAGNWLQRSGMRFTSSWDSLSSSWATPVIEVAKGGDDSWELLDLDRKYGIVTNQYIMDGNGGRNVIKNAAKEVNDTQKTVLSLMTEYFQHSSPVAPPLIRMHY